MAKLSDFISLIILVIVLGIAVAIGVIAYQIANDITDKTKQKMEKKNITFSREGVKVGVKQVSSEQVADSTQSVLMKVWSSAAWPGYKSKLGWGQSSSGTTTPAATPGGGAEKRKAFPKSASSQQNVKRA